MMLTTPMKKMVNKTLNAANHKLIDDDTSVIHRVIVYQQLISFKFVSCVCVARLKISSVHRG